MNKTVGRVTAICLLVNALGTDLAAAFTSLGDQYPGLVKYAAISTVVAAFFNSFAPQLAGIFKDGGEQ